MKDLGTYLIVFVVFISILNLSNQSNESEELKPLDERIIKDNYSLYTENVTPSCLGCYIDFMGSNKFISGLPVLVKFTNLIPDETYIIQLGNLDIRLFTTNDNEWSFSFNPEGEGKFKVWLGLLLNETFNEQKTTYYYESLDWFDLEIIPIDKIFPTEFFFNMLFAIVVFLIVIGIITTLVISGGFLSKSSSDTTNNSLEDFTTQKEFGQISCWNCGIKNEEDNKFCYDCGEEI